MAEIDWVKRETVERAAIFVHLLDLDLRTERADDGELRLLPAAMLRQA